MDKKYLGTERRKFPRLKIFSPIFYRLKTGDSFRPLRAICQSIGGGGLMFETEKPLPIESRLYLEIYQPSAKYKDLIFSLSTQAKVIWVSPVRKLGLALLKSLSNGVNKYQIGVKFTEIEKEDKDRIIEYVERIKRGSSEKAAYRSAPSPLMGEGKGGGV
ncbi:MAG: PilZ domain-containing protein [Nitrospirae bacterium]|nr:PilZ domain-containing protein [Nitrospirota bacterium]